MAQELQGTVKGVDFDGRIALLQGEVGFGLTQGNTPGKFECRGWRVRICICYDLRIWKSILYLLHEAAGNLLLWGSCLGEAGLASEGECITMTCASQ